MAKERLHCIMKQQKQGLTLKRENKLAKGEVYMYVQGKDGLVCCAFIPLGTLTAPSSPVYVCIHAAIISALLLPWTVFASVDKVRSIFLLEIKCDSIACRNCCCLHSAYKAGTDRKIFSTDSMLSLHITSLTSPSR